MLLDLLSDVSSWSELEARIPAMAGLYLELGDYGSAIALFLQNRPVKWDAASLPLWPAGQAASYTGG